MGSGPVISEGPGPSFTRGPVTQSKRNLSPGLDSCDSFAVKCSREIDGRYKDEKWGLFHFCWASPPPPPFLAPPLVGGGGIGRGLKNDPHHTRHLRQISFIISYDVAFLWLEEGGRKYHRREME
ncbi:hypothetical protein NPIL_417841 [Nephila pilipes]|uniref:Uncharacterized protein n=1 Tax=Nephila pilipes TaxID=299642 RepID=A0A8X6TEB4_NEPPI|nr:hypothetical protein NPIL_417841 [Nephila pilipes]